jgi:hypothetical protein
MIRYLVEDTPLISFLIKNGPKVVCIYPETNSTEKSEIPEQS